MDMKPHEVVFIYDEMEAVANDSSRRPTARSAASRLRDKAEAALTE